MAQTVLMNLQKGDLERTIRLAPHTWAPIEGMAPRIVPIRWIPEQEVQAYAMTLDLPFHDDECPHSHQALRILHRDMLLRWKMQSRNTPWFSSFIRFNKRNVCK